MSLQRQIEDDTGAQGGSTSNMQHFLAQECASHRTEDIVTAIAKHSAGGSGSPLGRARGPLPLVESGSSMGSPMASGGMAPTSSRGEKVSQTSSRGGPASRPRKEEVSGDMTTRKRGLKGPSPKARESRDLPGREARDLPSRDSRASRSSVGFEKSRLTPFWTR